MRHSSQKGIHVCLKLTIEGQRFVGKVFTTTKRQFNTTNENS